MVCDENASKWNAPKWNRAKVGHVKLGHVKLARAKLNAPNWHVILFTFYFVTFDLLFIFVSLHEENRPDSQ